MKTEKLSFTGFELWTFIKGRKRMAVTLIAGICGYFIMDSVTVATVSGGVVEVVFGLCEYYFKE